MKNASDTRREPKRGKKPSAAETRDEVDGKHGVLDTIIWKTNGGKGEQEVQRTSRVTKRGFVGPQKERGGQGRTRMELVGSG